MEERKQFTFFASFAKAVKRIRKQADRCAAYDAIVDYALFGIEPDLDSLPDAAAIAFELIRPNLDASKRKADGGKKGSPTKRTESSIESYLKEAAKIPQRYCEDTENEKEVEIEKEIENECLVSSSGDARAMYDKSLADLMAYYEDNMGSAAPRKVLECIYQWRERMPDDLIRAAIDTAAKAGKNWNYAEGCLKRWERDGIRTLAALQAVEAARQQQPRRKTAQDEFLAIARGEIP